MSDWGWYIMQGCQAIEGAAEGISGPMEGTSCVRGRVLYIRGPGNLMYINDDMFCHSTNIHVIPFEKNLWGYFVAFFHI